MNNTPQQVIDLAEKAVTATLNEVILQGTQDAAKPLDDYFAAIKQNPTQENLIAQSILLTVKVPLLLPTLEAQAISDFASNGQALLDELLALVPAKAAT